MRRTPRDDGMGREPPGGPGMQGLPPDRYHDSAGRAELDDVGDVVHGLDITLEPVRCRPEFLFDAAGQYPGFLRHAGHGFLEDTARHIADDAIQALLGVLIVLRDVPQGLFDLGRDICRDPKSFSHCASPPDRSA